MYEIKQIALRYKVLYKGVLLVTPDHLKYLLSIPIDELKEVIEGFGGYVDEDEIFFYFRSKEQGLNFIEWIESLKIVEKLL